MYALTSLTVDLYSRVCYFMAGCSDAKHELIIASSAGFRRGTTLQSTLFNGGVTGTFIKH